MSYLEIIILSFIEGLTEFIPVSSTGHLVLVSHLLNITPTEFTKAFDVIIQFGAILAVVFMYKKRFLSNIKGQLDFYKKLFIGFLPAAVIGFLLKNKIDSLLENTTVVAYALLIGGLFMILIDTYYDKKSYIENTDSINLLSSLKIGLFQCFALIPGVSRSASTIIGGQIIGLKRHVAAEYSFFLAVPTLTAAALYKTYKIKHLLHLDYAYQLTLGVVLSFIFSVIAIRFFIHIVSKYGFFWFGLYRVIIGLIVLFFNYKNAL